VHRLPVVFVIQNNQVALGTPVDMSHLPGSFDELHEAYGALGWSFDGNNVLDAYAATRLAVERCRAGEGPVILSAETFRMGGHATHDEQEARVVLPDELFEHWGKRDPIGLYEEYLTGTGVSRSELEKIESAVTGEIERAAEEALASRETHEPTPTSALDDVYAG
jgi:TPP-dependent pyruvate/acetoin dehydrogenase alpha subunit